MNFKQNQSRVRSSSVFDRACAVLCLLLLCFSVGHTVLGHGELQSPTQMPGVHAGWGHELAPVATDTPDACALCVAMATAVVLHVFAVSVPQAAQPRPPAVIVASGPVTGWHASLSCRPPPAV